MIFVSPLLQKVIPPIACTLEKVTRPDFPLYYEGQVLLFATITYIGTFSFSRIYPERAVTYVVIAYGIHQYLTPHFARFFAPLATSHIGRDAATASLLFCVFVISKISCHILRDGLTVLEIARVAAGFFITLFAIRIIESHCLNFTSRPINNEKKP